MSDRFRYWPLGHIFFCPKQDWAREISNVIFGTIYSPVPLASTFIFA